MTNTTNHMIDDHDDVAGYCDCCGCVIGYSPRTTNVTHDIWLMDTIRGPKLEDEKTGEECDPSISGSDDYIVVCTNPQCELVLRNAWRIFVNTLRNNRTG